MSTELTTSTVTPQQEDSADQMGRKTIIAKYCQRRLQEEGYKECVFLCLKRGRTYHAKDIPVKPNDPALGLDDYARNLGDGGSGILCIPSSQSKKLK